MQLLKTIGAAKRIFFYISQQAVAFKTRATLSKLGFRRKRLSCELEVVCSNPDGLFILLCFHFSVVCPSTGPRAAQHNLFFHRRWCLGQTKHNSWGTFTTLLVSLLVVIFRPQVWKRQSGLENCAKDALLIRTQLFFPSISTFIRALCW